MCKLVHQPLISIITPCYNSEKYIIETIESVLTQTYTNWEMIIVDDCSVDESYEIALGYSRKDIRVKVYRMEHNSGAALCRNKAIELSQGQYLAFLDSDDLWIYHKLETQLRFMQKNNCDFSFTEYEHINEKGEPLGIKAKIIKRLTYRRLLLHCFPGCLTVMYRQDTIGKIFCNDIKKNNDHALFLRVIKHSKNAMGVPKNLAKYRIRKNSISRRKVDMFIPYFTVVNKFEGINVFFSCFCVLAHVAVKMFFKYKKI